MLCCQSLVGQKKISKRFSDVEIKTVLSEIGKQADCQIVYDAAEVDENRLYSGKFCHETIESVLEKVLGPDFLIEQSEKTITISLKPATIHEEIRQASGAEIANEQTSVSAEKQIGNANIDSIITTTRTIVERRVDTVLNISEAVRHREILTEKPAEKTRKGHYLEAYAGVAYGGLDYAFDLGRVHGLVSGMGQIGYSYFFTPSWGIGVGVDFENYYSHAHSDATLTWDNVTDSDGEPYSHRSKMNDWTEKNRSLMVGIPITAQFQHIFEQKNIGIFADLGVRAGFLFNGQYEALRGSVDHTGYYDKWHLTLENLHDFYRQEPNGERGAIACKPSIGLTGSVGALFPIHEQVDLVTSLFFNCGLNDSYGGERTDLGFTSDLNPQYKYDFMPEYEGFANSNHAGAMRPYSVGVKVGVRWHPTKKAKKIIDFEPYNVVDTAITLRERFDTIQTVTYDTIADPLKSIREYLASSVIWFNFDRAVPKLKPADMLDKLAEYLIANPHVSIEISGHTCKLGNVDYNQRLSERRANAVADALKKKGVNPKQLHVKAYGKSAVNHDSADQLHLDRRVEITPILTEQE